MNTLYQFPFSHFCEKARWALDYKGQPYTVKNLLPGLHLRTTSKMAAKTCVPILVAGNQVIQEAHAIIDHLDRSVPAPPLTPRDPQLAREAREWERYLDEEIGVTLRCWFYHHTLPNRAAALSFILRDAPWYGGPLFAVIFPQVRQRMIEFMKIGAESARDAERRMLEAFGRLDAHLRDHRFLVGNQFSRADLSACALLGPLVMSDPQEEQRLAPAVADFRKRHAERPCLRWVEAVYREFRAPLRMAA